MIKTMRSEYTISELCDALDVSTSGFHRWAGATPGLRTKENQLLVSEMRTIHQDPYLRAYGSPRMVTELNNRGYPCSENRVARLMASEGIHARFNPKWKPRTTVQNPRSKPSPNLLKDLPQPTAAGEIWVSDITYVFTRNGTHYLAVIMDLFTRQIVGWEFDDHMESSLVENALLKAEARHPRFRGSIFHSDRGSQYSSQLIRDHLSGQGYRQSMSALGYCYDNAFCESFFATFKKESFPPDQLFESPATARREIFSYLESFYNSRRIHTSLGNLSPDQFCHLHLQSN